MAVGRSFDGCSGHLGEQRCSDPRFRKERVVGGDRVDPPSEIGVEATEDEAEGLSGPGFAAKRLRRQADLEIEGVV